MFALRIVRVFLLVAAVLTGAWSASAPWAVGSDHSNIAPTIVLTQPTVDITSSPGSIISIEWTDSDPDDNAQIALAVDPDDCTDCGLDHTWIAEDLQEDADGAGGQFAWDTTGVSEGTYYIWAMIEDDENTEVFSVASGRLSLVLLYPEIDVSPASFDIVRYAVGVIGTGSESLHSESGPPRPPRIGRDAGIPPGVGPTPLAIEAQKGRHAVVEFAELPPVSELTAAGLIPLGYVRDDTIIVSVPESFDARTIDGLQSISALQMTDKISHSAEAILRGAIDGASVTLMVEHFSDVRAGRFNAVVRTAGGGNPARV